MKIRQLNESKPICIGTGLVALDVIISGEQNTPVQFLAGGSCGNVITILSYLGWQSYPIARLSNNAAAEMLIEDLYKWGVRNDLLTITEDGSTPIIIHRILKDDQGMPKHRFEFKNPEDGKYLPSYKPCLARSVDGIVHKVSNPNVFYFDRINRASIDLAKFYKSKGAVIFFEPSSLKDMKGFKECLSVADVVKFSDDRIPNYDEIFFKAQVSLEIQTSGKKGLHFRRKDSTSWMQLPGYSIENVVDSAGAGDWCTAGIISNLFNLHSSFDEISDTMIKSSLQFGQVLSALNCTFEGARGLMYNLSKSELLLSVEHILSSNMTTIAKKPRERTMYSNAASVLKISSLL